MKLISRTAELPRRDWSTLEAYVVSWRSNTSYLEKQTKVKYLKVTTVHD